ncbi:PQQ-dependent sugar dehydrogenase [Lysobacter sp. A6]|uniref:PQQ-dependent sugar dehydrogenase n=1 Tax=Noviluteimonas lactosilytica TaxID=2888523 RepID=A0ABS8JDW1_9GAMM|nr:PQQ-dependent sugar dehydrogenase [Lysobacter lactosilyticus]MCC8361791.1 PQQ-dependent sugar dehydrogenase [Lysobacter lactosilyticus]
MSRKISVLMMALAVSACSSQQSSATATASASGGDASATATASTTAGVSAAMRVETLAQGLEHPWSVALLPDGSFLVTERPGRLRHVSADGKLSPAITGVPAVFAQGQGGLLDVVLAPDYATSKRIWLSYAEPGDDDTAGTAVATATLNDNALSDVRVVYRQAPKLTGGNHFGSRIVFDGNGHVFISQGERNDRPTAQKLDMLQGKLVRLNLDGSVPKDNPFVGRKDARPEIYSYGHRNMQGMALDPRTGTLWENEHGPRGGDEINLPQAGKNYGWPIITNGIDYSGLKISESVGTSAPGMEQPHHFWAKSPGLSGMAFYTGRPGSAWNDSLFIGSLAESNLIRLSLKGNAIAGEERLLTDLGARIRDVRVGNDGNVYVLTDEDDGKLLRLKPPGAK